MIASNKDYALFYDECAHNSNIFKLVFDKEWYDLMYKKQAMNWYNDNRYLQRFYSLRIVMKRKMYTTEVSVENNESIYLFSFKYDTEVAPKEV